MSTPDQPTRCIAHFSDADWTSDFQIHETDSKQFPGFRVVTLEVAKGRYVAKDDATPRPASTDYEAAGIVGEIQFMDDLAQWEKTQADLIVADDDVPLLLEDVSHYDAYLRIRDLMARGYRCPTKALNDLVILGFLTSHVYAATTLNSPDSTTHEKTVAATALRIATAFNELDLWSAKVRDLELALAAGD